LTFSKCFHCEETGYFSSETKEFLPKELLSSHWKRMLKLNSLALLSNLLVTKKPPSLERATD
jgi:hypothetical protein